MQTPRTLELLGCPPSGKAVARMTPKGHSPVDLESAEPATSRRSLLGALGVAGLAGVAAVAVARPASAAPQPYSPTPSDREILSQALQLELAVQRLYREAIDAGLDGEAAEVARVFAKNHEYYADQFAAITGISANTFNEEAFEANRAAFATADVAEFAVAAWTLENNAAVTYRELLTEFEAIEAQQSVSAIAVMNGRMATVLADLAGVSDDLDVLFDPPGEAITLTDTSEDS
jgi:hypothetical protein